MRRSCGLKPPAVRICVAARFLPGGLFLGVSLSLGRVIRGVPWRGGAECIVRPHCSLFLNVSEMWRHPARRAMANLVGSLFCKSGFVFPLGQHYGAFLGSTGMSPPVFPSCLLAMRLIFRLCFEMHNNRAKGRSISPQRREQCIAAFVVKIWLNTASIAEMWCSAMRQNQGVAERRFNFRQARFKGKIPHGLYFLAFLTCFRAVCTFKCVSLMPNKT